MANKLNNFPPAGLPVSAGIKPLNRDPRTSYGTAYYVTDALSIDFRIQGFVNNNSDATNTHINEYKKNGVKFIINTAGSIPTAISNSYESGISGGYGPLGIGDVVVWNGSQAGGSGGWELWYDASSTGISGASGGAFGYVVEENQFYGYFGDVLGWDTVGVGNTGNTGNTGSDALVGAKYVQQADVNAVDGEGKINVSNSVGHSIRVHRNAAGLNGFAGATSDLMNAFFPKGVAASNDDTNPKVVVSFYNDTINQTYAIRASLKAAAIAAETNELILSSLEDDAGKYNSFEVLSSTSGSGSWIGAGIAWDTNDEIYVLAVSDGVAGIDGTPGAPGVTGQGITFGGNIEGELHVQYLDADGISFGDAVPTGIVDGASGDPGEVGFLVAATGASADLGGQMYWGNNTTGNTGDVATGEIFYTIVDGEKIIAVSYSTKEVAATTSTPSPYIFGFTAGDAQNGTDYQKKSGSVYFYEQINKTLILRSFLKYTDVRCTGVAQNDLVLIKGISDNPMQVANEAERLGFTLPTTPAGTKDIYTLVVPDGIKGVGITFGVKIDNKLFLDYIDENGNTFGRFESIAGITGPQGSMNPFNIPFTAITGSASIDSGQIKVTLNSSSSVLESVTLSITGGNGDFVGDYLNYPIASGSLNNSGYLSVFSPADVTDFGVFRFRAGVSAGNTITFGTTEKPISHVAGNITDIINVTDSTTGFTVGSNLLFAINTDGMRGLSGEIGEGFTYGNEYFISSIENKPELRSDNQPLEPGDKWFCTDVALEFTYMGESGGDWSGTPNKGRDDIWLQTNNARQGQQGPRGDKGENGTVGTVGATGINDFSTWSLGPSYSSRHGVYVTRQSCLAATNVAQDIIDINTNWNLLNSNQGATNGFFVVKTDAPGGFTTKIPGQFSGGNQGWNSSLSPWSPVVTNTEGVQGVIGNTGATGQNVIGFIAESSGENVFLDALLQDNNGIETTVNIQDSGGNNVNFRGPTGPAGNITGSVNQLIYVSGDNTGVGTNSATRLVTNNGVDKLILNNYREQVTENTSITSNTLTVDCNVPVTHYELSSSPTIDTVNLTNMDGVGDGATVYIKAVGQTVTWNANSKANYKINNGDSPDNLFISSQGFPTPGKIEFPSSGDFLGAFTFKYVDSSPSTIIVNFVPFVLPQA